VTCYCCSSSAVGVVRTTVGCETPTCQFHWPGLMTDHGDRLVVAGAVRDPWLDEPFTEQEAAELFAAESGSEDVPW
jgi:hypothetical protein